MGACMFNWYLAYLQEISFEETGNFVQIIGTKLRKGKPYDKGWNSNGSRAGKGIDRY